MDFFSKLEVSDFRIGMLNEDGTQQMRLLVQNHKIQKTLDKLQKILVLYCSL